MAEMTNERKVSILENLLLERDKQIKRLQSENAELKKEIEGFGNDIQELQDIMTDVHKLKREFLGTNRQMKLLKKRYERNMRMV